ncbi:putative cytochrome P450 E-class, group I [Podospora australis]|uniref:Cytochrome P450 E-class, group I n=1 Tax=Podospora australis TaxID=1536484 RepID=A0AAN6WME6_9PEZI|nr:putative cytochrome P450 E-class, group I [Podospora australis]
MESTYPELTRITRANAVLAVAALILTYLLITRIFLFRRLSHIPGPKLASWTALYLVRHQLSGRVARHVVSLSKRYGPICRIAPNWVIISSPSEVRRVWQARGPWYRGRWYEIFRFDQPIETVMSLRKNTDHAALRSKLVPGYSGKDVENIHSVIDARVADFVSLIERKYLSSKDGGFKPMDLAIKSQFFTLDVISDLAIGTCFNCLQEDSDTYGQISSITGSLPLILAMAIVPTSLLLLQNPIARALLPKDKVEGLMRQQALAQKNAARRFGESKEVRRDMMGSFVAHGLSWENVWLETFGQIGAGTDTTATAIRMTMFFLMSSPGAYNRLQTEIDTGIQEGRISSPVTDEESRKLVYLQAVIKEGLRMWPPVQGLNPKICDTEQVVCGKRIPAGTNVCWDALSVMQDKEVFGDDAEVFRPERWLDEAGVDPDRKKVMEQVQGLVFGTPSRWECLGKQIALFELNKVFVEVSSCSTV